MENQECAFCDADQLFREKRLIHYGKSILTIVSNPSFRPYHVLIIPQDHKKELNDLRAATCIEFIKETRIMQRVVRNLMERDLGRNPDSEDEIPSPVGTIFMQKTEPVEVDNGITVAGHLHGHIYPFIRPMTQALAPAPVSKNDFRHLTLEEARAYRNALEEERSRIANL